MIPLFIEGAIHCTNCEEVLSTFDDVCKCGYPVDWDTYYQIQEDEDE